MKKNNLKIKLYFLQQRYYKKGEIFLILRPEPGIFSNVKNNCIDLVFFLQCMNFLKIVISSIDMV